MDEVYIFQAGNKRLGLSGPFPVWIRSGTESSLGHGSRGEITVGELVAVIMSPGIIGRRETIAREFGFNGSHLIARDGNESRFVIAIFIRGGD